MLNRSSDSRYPCLITDEWMSKLSPMHGLVNLDNRGPEPEALPSAASSLVDCPLHWP